MTNLNWFRVFGVLTILFVVGVLITSVMTAHLSPRPSPLAYARLSIFVVIGLIIGIGLLFLRKWAALCFSSGSLALAIWMVVGSILYWPFPAMLIILGIGLSFIFPAVLTLRCWSHLIWRGKGPI
jgi:hypothetical protein